MQGLTTFSWLTFFVLLGIIAIIWVFTTKTKVGRLIIENETPWNQAQWTRLLLVVIITLFILVDPIFHLTTFGIFISLYYIIVNKNFLNTNIRKIRVKNEGVKSGLAFIVPQKKILSLTCVPSESQDLISERNMLNKCLFSFPYIDDDTSPIVQYLNGSYNLELYLSSEKYTSSLIGFIEKAGFQVSIKQ